MEGCFELLEGYSNRALVPTSPRREQRGLIMGELVAREKDIRRHWRSLSAVTAAPQARTWRPRDRFGRMKGESFASFVVPSARTDEHSFQCTASFERARRNPLGDEHSSLPPSNLRGRCAWAMLATNTTTPVPRGLIRPMVTIKRPCTRYVPTEGSFDHT